MPRTPRRNTRGKRPLRADQGREADDDNESIQSPETNLQTPVPRMTGESSGQANQQQQHSDRMNEMMAQLLQQMENMEQECQQECQELEALRQQQQHPQRTSTSSQEIFAGQLACILQSQQNEEEKEEDRLTKKAKEYWRDILKLQGQENYQTWKKDIENDANILQALSVLQHQPINQTDREQTRWETCNRLLVKHMLDQMTC